MKSFSYKHLWSVALPLMLAELMELLINITDILIAGRLSSIALAAIGFCSIYHFGFVYLIFGLGNGIQTFVAKSISKNKIVQAGDGFKHGMLILSFLAFSLSAIMYVSLDLALDTLIQGQELRSLCHSYLGIRLISFPVIGFITAFNMFYLGISRSYIIFIIALVTAGFNAILNYILVFGKFGLPGLGLNGSAIGSTIAEGLGLVIFVLYSIFDKKTKPYLLYNWSGIDKKIIKSTMKFGSPALIHGWMSSFSWIFFFVLVERISTEAVAASTIIENIYLIIMVPILAFSTAGSTLISTAGAKVLEFNNIVLKTIFSSLALCFVLIALVLIFYQSIVTIYTKDLKVSSLVQTPLRVVLTILLVACISNSLVGCINGTGSAKYLIYIELCTLISYFIYLGILYRYQVTDLNIIWLSELVYVVVLGLGGYVMYKSGKWKGYMLE
ncbi:MAG: MATE family efflux transporter [Bacteroidota bacterium]|nr:MATE family efflux transporter [Bacteroidota bacterium]